MRTLSLSLLLLLLCTIAHAQSSQVRVDVECEQVGRTKFCPAFLLGFVDANKVLLSSPRAGADVVVYATANAVSLDDQIHLRFVGHMPGAPDVIELDAMVDTRMTDDQQRAVLEPVFVRGIALFVAARYPEAVNVTLTAPKQTANGVVETSPWGVTVAWRGNGSYTNKYQSANGELDLKGTYLEREFRALALVSASGGLNYQPPLTLDDGSTVSLDVKQWQFNFGGEAIKLLNDTWSVGFGWYTGISDPKAQYAYNGHARGALEYDVFPADDPRGNRLGVFYHLGWAYERYNIRNVLGEHFAHYPVSGIDAVGSVRRDGIAYGLTLQSDLELDHPGRRVILTATPNVTFQIGRHVDLSLTMSVTERHLPLPDPNAIDPSDYAQLSRLSYAEPLVLTGTFALTLHWDPTNGARNDRINSI